MFYSYRLLFAVRGMRLRERMHFPYNTNSL